MIRERNYRPIKKVLFMDYSKPCQYSTRLVEKLTSLDTKKALDFDLINKAIYWAKKYHDGQFRKSGEPFYTHPLEVAYLFSEYVGKYELQYYTTDLIITAILHDTIEDTLLTKEMILEGFNESVATKVYDLTRIKVDYKTSAGDTLELIYSQNKTGVLYIKIFDRLHNMKTISFMPETKRNRIVDETIECFVSLCSVLGLYEVKKELIILSYHYKLSQVPQEFINMGSSLSSPFSASYLIKLNSPQP
jgi:(p)ppGpp synthase/HD superfamily hydrolase